MKLEFQAIGTSWVIDINQNITTEEESILFDKIMKRISEFDLAYSRFRDDSLVTKMSLVAGEYILPSDADKMISIYKKVYDVTNGLVTPLIGKILVDAGYDASYSLKEKPLTKPLSWEETMVWQNPKLILNEPALLDFGAGGKGYLVDIVSEILEENGIKNYCVDASGDMRQRSFNQTTLKVGLENPKEPSEVIGVVQILNKSICGSSGNRRKWGNFHHIINPETLSSPKDIEAVWVVSDSTLLSDILTTALFFVKPEVVLKTFDFDYLIIYYDFSITKSEGFKAELFT